MKKTRVVITLCCAVILLVVVGLLINSSILSKRQIFASSHEMQVSLSGVWVYWTEHTAVNAVEINGDELTWYLYNDDEGRKQKITYSPSRGMFMAGSDKYYVIKSNEAGKTDFYLSCDDDKYTLGTLGSLDRNPYSDSYASDIENAHKAAGRYTLELKKNNPEISGVSINSAGSCTGDFYYFDCSVVYKSGVYRNGEIIVLKDDSDNFIVDSLIFH